MLKIGDDFGKVEVVPEIEGLENWENVCPVIQTPGISPDEPLGVPPEGYA